MSECSSQDAKPNSESISPSGQLLTEMGEVQAIDEHFAYVIAQRSSGCSGCASSSSCGTSALSKLFNNSAQTPIKVRNTLNAQVGNQVLLTLDESRLIKHSFMAYGVPLIGLFGIAIGFKQLALWWFDWSPAQLDWASIIGGVVGLAMGWALTRRFYRPVMPEMAQIMPGAQAINSK